MDRPAFDYDRSLGVLATARGAGMVTKSNLILGMGETSDEIRQAPATCATPARSCSRSPSTCARLLKHHPIDRWVTPEEFAQWEDEAKALGYAGVLSGPLVRSSYRAVAHR